jgi:hypothetical protein
MKKPRGPIIWTEPDRTPPALGFAIVLAYALGVVLVLLAFVA